MKWKKKLWSWANQPTRSSNKSSLSWERNGSVWAAFFAFDALGAKGAGYRCLVLCCLLVHVLSKDARQHSPQPTGSGTFHARLCRGSPALVAVADRTPPHSSTDYARRKPSAAAAAVAIAHAERRSAATAAAAHAERRSAATAHARRQSSASANAWWWFRPSCFVRCSSSHAWCSSGLAHDIAEILSLIEWGNRGIFLSGSRYFIWDM